MSKQNLAKTLSDLVDKELRNEALPVKSGNRINIGSYSIKPTKEGYSIMSYKSNAVVAVTYSKHAALAIAKTLNKDKKLISNIMELDKVVAKHNIDCMFYNHILRNTKNDIMYGSTINRYEISKSYEEEARNKLKAYIF